MTTTTVLPQTMSPLRVKATDDPTARSFPEDMGSPNGADPFAFKKQYEQPSPPSGEEQLDADGVPEEEDDDDAASSVYSYSSSSERGDEEDITSKPGPPPPPSTVAPPTAASLIFPDLVKAESDVKRMPLSAQSLAEISLSDTKAEVKDAASALLTASLEESVKQETSKGQKQNHMIRNALKTPTLMEALASFTLIDRNEFKNGAYGNAPQDEHMACQCDYKHGTCFSTY